MLRLELRDGLDVRPQGADGTSWSNGEAFIDDVREEGIDVLAVLGACTR